MESAGYSNWLKDIKALLEEDKLELVGSAAYNACLTELPEPLLSDQVILNEYGLGYFFGRRSGFEGESAVLMKGLKGFCAPGNFLNQEVFDLISGLGYSWILTNEPTPGVFKLAETDCHILSPNAELSEKISSRQGLEISDIVGQIQASEDCVAALDGEIFGYKNKDGIYMLNKLLDSLAQAGVECIPASEFIEEELDESKVSALDQLNTKEYDRKSSALWKVNQGFLEILKGKLAEMPKIQEEGMENIAVWAQDLPKEIQVPVLSAQICDRIQFEDPAYENGFSKLYSQLANLLDEPKLSEQLSL